MPCCDLYAYDENGNRLSEERNSVVVPYTYEALSNRLDTKDADNWSLDAAGNVTSRGSEVMVYDDPGRLIWLYNAGNSMNYGYNAANQRVHKFTSGYYALYFRDLNGRLISEIIHTGSTIEYRDIVWDYEKPVSQHTLITDQSGNTLSQQTGYIMTDALTTPRVVTNELDAIVWQWDSDGFGAAGPDEDVDGDGVDYTLNLRFPGQYFDSESGFYYNWNRYYDPETGRYVTSDPIGLEGGLNTFVYVYGNPGRFVDPQGLLHGGPDDCLGPGECKCKTAECAAKILPNPPRNECVESCLVATNEARGAACKYLGHPAAIAICKKAARIKAIIRCTKGCDARAATSCPVDRNYG